MKCIFQPSADKKFAKLPPEIKKRIITKLDFFTSTSNPLLFAEPLSRHEIGQYRFRIGDYRIIFDLKDKDIIILNLGHRRDIYR